MAKALGSLNSFSADLTETFHLATAAVHPPEYQGSIVLAKPNLLRFSLSGGGQSSTVVSDGQHIFITGADSRRLYDRTPAPPTTEAVFQAVGARAPRPFSEIGLLFRGTGFLDAMVQGGGLQSVTVSPAAPIGGVPIMLLTAKYEGPRGASMKEYLALDHATHLPVRLTAETPVGSSVLTLSNEKTNFPVERQAFVFTPPPGPISPEAQAVLDASAAAYAAMKGLSGIAVTTAAGAEPMTLTTRFAWERPNLLNAVMQNGAHKSILISNGTTVTSTSSPEAWYQQAKAPASLAELANGGSQDYNLSVLGSFFDADDPFELGALTKMMKSMKVSGTDTLDGTAVQVLEADLKPGDPGSPVSVSFAIATGDHLVRRVVMKTDSAAMTTVFGDLKADPDLPSSTFQYTPPAGSVLVAGDQPPTFDPRLKVGTRPFPFEATDLDGRPVNLADYAGKVVLLDFWATWCPPCRAEIPNVVAAYKKYHAAGFEILGVSLDREDARDTLPKFLQDNGMLWKQVYTGQGWDSPLPVAYGVQAIPFSLLIGRDGRISAVDARAEELAPAVQKALHQPAP